MLADRSDWDLRRRYQVPAELAAAADRYQTIGISPRQWVRSGGNELVHPMIVQQRRTCTLSGEVVAEFIKTVLAFKGACKEHVYCVGDSCP